MKLARQKFKVEVPSVAMGDIAFNLLVFFVILAKAQDDGHVQWQPTATTKVEAAKHPLASIAVDKNNKLFLNGREISETELTHAVETRLGNAPVGERVVLLKIDKNAQAARFEPILQSVSEAGGEILHVLNEKRPDAARK